jgi:hypothetical protein
MLPFVGAGVLFCLLVFALYVRSVPPKVVTTIPANATLTPDLMEKLGPDTLEQLSRMGLLTKEPADGSDLDLDTTASSDQSVNQATQQSSAEL